MEPNPPTSPRHGRLREVVQVVMKWGRGASAYKVFRLSCGHTVTKKYGGRAMPGRAMCPFCVPPAPEKG